MKLYLSIWLNSNRRTWAFLFIIGLFFSGSGEIVTKTIEYTHDTTVLKGILIYNTNQKGKRPGVLVYPEWWGLTSFPKEKAKQLASEGYVAFVADMYGNGRTTDDPKVAGKLAGGVRKNNRMKPRAKAAYETLKSQKMVDTSKMAALGFCFGGTTALSLALTDVPLEAAVSFHGGLPQPDSAGLENLQSFVLIFHGADDPNVSQEEIQIFYKALQKTNSEWEAVVYGNAVHSFTNPASGSDKSRGVAYDSTAANRSWQYMLMVFDRMF